MLPRGHPLSFLLLVTAPLDVVAQQERLVPPLPIPHVARATSPPLPRLRPCAEAAQSWIGTGPNQRIASNDLERALGSDTLNALSKQTGVAREDLLAGLSQHLPDLIDQLTPNGRLPTEAEASRMV